MVRSQGLRPYNPARGLDPLTPRLASKATGLDASLGIELLFWRIGCRKMIISTRPYEGSCSDARAEQWAFLGRAPLRGPRGRAPDQARSKRAPNQTRPKRDLLRIFFCVRLEQGLDRL